MSRLLVLALHGSPGDPQRAHSDFGFLKTPGRNLEFLLLSDRIATAREQLLALAERYRGAEISVAPLLLGAGYHYQHDLLPALSACRGCACCRGLAAARLLPTPWDAPCVLSRQASPCIGSCRAAPPWPKTFAMS